MDNTVNTSADVVGRVVTSQGPTIVGRVIVGSPASSGGFGNVLRDSVISSSSDFEDVIQTNTIYNTYEGTSFTQVHTLPRANDTQAGVMPKESFIQIETNTNKIASIAEDVGNLDTSVNNLGQLVGTLATVAKTGNYNDLINRPTIPVVNNSTVTINQGGVQKGTFTLNQSTPATINLDLGSSSSFVESVTGTMVDNTDPQNPVVNSDTTKQDALSTSQLAVVNANPYTTAEQTKLAGITAGANVNVQVDWAQTNNTLDDYIKNKPTIPTVNDGTITVNQGGQQKGVFTVNQSGNTTINLELGDGNTYVETVTGTMVDNTDPQNPVIIHDDSKQDALTADQLLVTNGLPFSSDYRDKLNGIAAGAEVNVQSDWSVTDNTSDAYILNKPTIPVVNNGTLTIQRSSSDSGTTFTANQAGNTNINLNLGTMSEKDAANYRTAADQDTIDAEFLKPSNVIAGNNVTITPDSTSNDLTISVSGIPTPTKWTSTDNGPPAVNDTGTTLLSTLTKLSGGNASATVGDVIIFTNGVQGEITAVDSTTATFVVFSPEPETTVWGTIGGQITNQTDLQLRLDSKVNINQGMAYAGKPMVVGADGLVAPATTVTNYVETVTGTMVDNTDPQNPVIESDSTKQNALTNNQLAVVNATPFTQAKSDKLDGIAAGAEVNVQSDWSVNDSSSDAYILNKPSIPTVNNPTITVNQGGTLKGSFTLNQSTPTTINLDLGDGNTYVKTVTGTMVDNTNPQQPIINSDSTKQNALNTSQLAVVNGVPFSQAQSDKLTGIQDGAEMNVQSDWSVTDNTNDAYIKNKPTLSTVATSNDWRDLYKYIAWNSTTSPSATVGSTVTTSQTSLTAVLNLRGAGSSNIAISDWVSYNNRMIGVVTGVSGTTSVSVNIIYVPPQPDWSVSDNTSPNYIANKPTLATIATSGDPNDLISNVPFSKGGTGLASANAGTVIMGNTTGLTAVVPDSQPTSGSTNPITSGAVYTAVHNIPIPQATNSDSVAGTTGTLGTVMGETGVSGKVYIENDGTMTVTGFDDLQNEIGNIPTPPVIIHNIVVTAVTGVITLTLSAGTTHTPQVNRVVGGSAISGTWVDISSNSDGGEWTFTPTTAYDILDNPDGWIVVVE